tara:strand:+ start:3283 stop:3519 length:237 start_codon:yes stop_codon:yes gene_type:complete
MAKKAVKAPVVTAAVAPSTMVVMVMAKNVWDSRAKWLQYDIVEVSSQDGALMVEKKLAKETKDDATHTISREGNRVEV